MCAVVSQVTVVMVILFRSCAQKCLILGTQSIACMVGGFLVVSTRLYTHDTSQIAGCKSTRYTRQVHFK